MSENITESESAFDTFLSNAFSALVKATKVAGRLPSDINFHRTVSEDLDAKLSKASAKTLTLTTKLQPSNTVENIDDIAVLDNGKWMAGRGYRKAISVLDSTLEKIDVGLDTALNRTMHVASQSAPRVVSSGDVRFVHAQNVPRPQLAFDDTIDNSPNTAFAWKIRDKPHAQVPLDFGLPSAEVIETPIGSHLQTMGISRSGSATPMEGADVDISSIAALPHPYEYEITHIEYPQQLFEVVEPKQPRDWDSTPFVFVDSVEQLTEMMGHVIGEREIAIDLEHHNYRSYQGFTCLVQLSTRTRDYVVDALALRSNLHVLNSVTADPNVVKVLHGAESDVQWLQRDFGVYIVGLFDTYHASKILNTPRHSLAYLLKTYCDFDADKKYQLADWRIRPVPAEMMHYARADTHFLLYVFDRMRNELVERGRDLIGEDLTNPESPHFGDVWGVDAVVRGDELTKAMLARSARTSLRVYEKDGYDAACGEGPAGWAPLLRKWNHSLTHTQLAVFKALHAWRDSCARDEDESTRYVLPNHMLFALADKMPADVPALLAACQPTPPLIRLNANEIVALIADARANTSSVEVGPSETQSAVPVHMRFDDSVEVGRVEDDVLCDKEITKSVDQLMAAQSTLFGDAGDEIRDTEAGRKASEIRKNLVLTVAVPETVVTHAAEDEERVEHEFVPAEDRKPAVSLVAASSKDRRAPVVVSETYAKYKPEKKDQKGQSDQKDQKDDADLGMSKIALGDIDDDSMDERAETKRSKRRSKNKRKANSSNDVSSSHVKPFDYSSVEGGDVIGATTVTMDNTKKAKRDARKRDARAAGKGKHFDPYGSVAISKEFAKKHRSKVNVKSGNRSMTFKK